MKKTILSIVTIKAILISISIFALMGCAGNTQPTVMPVSKQVQTMYEASIYDRAILKEVNRIRSMNNVAPLTMLVDPCNTVQYAFMRTANASRVANSHFERRVESLIKSVYNETGWAFGTAGELLGKGNAGNVQALVKVWYAKPSTRKLILDKAFTHASVISVRNSGRPYFSLVAFGNRR